MKKQLTTSVIAIAAICLISLTPGIALSKVYSENPLKLQPASDILVAQNEDDQGEDNDDQVMLQPASHILVA